MGDSAKTISRCKEGLEDTPSGRAFQIAFLARRTVPQLSGTAWTGSPAVPTMRACACCLTSSAR